jgi:hypothetical protein
MVRQDQGNVLISFPFTAGCTRWVITGRSSDLSRLLTPSHPPEADSGVLSEAFKPWEGLASQQRELSPNLTVFPFDSIRLRRTNGNQ